jgi:HAD superfamily hydrolase (TIGR01549 family)
MVQALLLDLDNTLLGNDMEVFLPAYLASLSKHVSHLFEQEPFIQRLLQATDAMMVNTDPATTNQEAFDAAFFPCLGRTREELEPVFEDFYATRFPELRSVTELRPESRTLVDWAFEQDLRIAVATNPMFPLTAIEQRLEWAGVPVDRYPYHLVTSYESMHATKPHTAYYQEMARRLGQQPEHCLMVGDEWHMDIQPAQSLGMQTYWITSPDIPPPVEDESLNGYGSLPDLVEWIKSY